MPTYSKADYERIAKGLGKGMAEVQQQENEFEGTRTLDPLMKSSGGARTPKQQHGVSKAFGARLADIMLS